MLKTHSWRTASLVIALTAIVGLAVPALGDARPFKGHADEVATVDGQVGNDLLVTGTGAGRATHLGSFTRLASLLYARACTDMSMVGPSAAIAPWSGGGG